MEQLSWTWCKNVKCFENKVCTQSKQMIESKELHQKIEAKSDKELSVFVHNDSISLVSGKSS